MFVMRFVATTIITLAMIVAVIIVATLFATLVGGILWLTFQKVKESPSEVALTTLSVLGFSVGLVVAGIGMLFLTGAVNHWLKTESGKVFAAYLKAKKQKACPIVRFI